MVLLLFGGFLLNKDEVPWYVSWIADLSYFNYGYEVRLVAFALSAYNLQLIFILMCQVCVQNGLGNLDMCVELLILLRSISR